MQTIDFEQLDLTSDDTFFHFSPKKFETDIEQQGLQPRIGDNSKGSESVPKVFVSRSGEAVLRMLLTFIRRSMWAVDDSKNGQVPGYPNRVNRNDEKSIKECMFYLVREYFKKCNYYNISDVRRTSIHDYLYMQEDERKSIDFVDNDVHDNGYQMSKPNSHLINGRSVPLEKIKKITINDNYNTSALDIIMRTIEKNRELRFLGEQVEIFSIEELKKNMIVNNDDQYRKLALNWNDREYYADSNDTAFFFAENGEKVILGRAETSWIDEFYDYCKEREKEGNNIKRTPDIDDDGDR